MKLLVFALFDTVSGSFAQPHCAVNQATATRSAQDLVKRDEALRAHVEDYTLFQIGTYDDSTGKLEPLGQPEMVVRLASLIN